MHETDKEQSTLEEILAVLKKIEHAQMSTFVQMSRIYDVLAVNGLGASPVEVLEVIEGHQQGLIHTAEPALAEFGAGFDEEETDK